MEEVDDSVWQTEPRSAEIAGMTVSVVLRSDEPSSAWTAVVVFSHRPGRARLDGDDVGAVLEASTGAPFAAIDSPSGPLVEVGGGRSRSTNAVFRFAKDGREPARIDLSYQAERCRFALLDTTGDRHPKDSASTR